MSDSTRLDSTQSTGLMAAAARPPIDPASPTRLVDSTPTRPTDSAPTDPTQSGDPTRPDSGRDWVVDLGMGVGGLAAIVASFTTLTALGRLVGWGRLDWLLPVTLDTFVITATRVWMSQRTRSAKVRRFAAKNAIGAIVLSLVGNATYHAIHANAWHPGEYFWLLVVLVSSLPPVAIGLISHLAVLRSRDLEFAAGEAAEAAAKVDYESTRPAESTDPTRLQESAPVAPTRPDPVESTQPVVGSAPTRLEAGEAVDRPDPTPATKPDPPDSDDPDPLLKEAHRLDREHRKSTGRHIGADRLREELGVGSARARALRDAVRGVHAVDPRRATG